MTAIFRLSNNSLIKRLIQPAVLNARTISTSQKKNETATATDQAESDACETQVAQKNWVSYGFQFNDKATDRRATHSIFFFGITLCMVIGGFIWVYIPDYQLRDWAQREAYIELRKREKIGLPPIDSNLINPDKIALPNDEELGETDIII